MTTTTPDYWYMVTYASTRDTPTAETESKLSGVTVSSTYMYNCDTKDSADRLVDWLKKNKKPHKIAVWRIAETHDTPPPPPMLVTKWETSK